MADDKDNAEQQDGGEKKPGLVARLKGLIPDVAREPLRGGRDMWQIPALLVAALLIAGGVRSWIANAPGADFPGALSSVEAHLDARQYAKAVEILNGPILNNLHDPALTREDLARFWALRADALYLLAREQGVDRFENHKAVVENYEAARAQYGAELAGLQQARLADSLLAMDRHDRALEESVAIPDDLADRRRRIQRAIVDHGLRGDATSAQRQRSFELLSRLRNDSTSDDSDRLWAVVRQSRLSLESGHPDDAIRRLLPEIQRMDSRLSPEAGELLTLLGEAYFDLGLIEDARERLELAEQIMPATDRVAARAGVLLGRIDQAQDDIEVARDRFTAVASRFPNSPEGVAAWLGYAEASADLGEHSAALRGYQEVVLGLLGDRAVGDVSAEIAHASIAQRHDQQMALDDPVTGLRYATLALRLFDDDSMPPEAIDRLARAHRSVADLLISSQPRTPEGVIDLSEADPTTLEQTRQHFDRAGAYFLQHARMSLLGDAEVSRNSLWEAADSYDNAGDLDMATQLFGDYVEMTHDDPRQLEGRFRLGKAWLGRGDYDNAIEFFEQLIQENETSEEAYKSFVPLAKAYLLASDWADHERAERLLLRVSDGQLFAPSAPEYRTALLELGGLYRRIGRNTESIERMTEAGERYPDLLEDPRFAFDLAQACRQEAVAIRDRLREALPSTERVRLQRLQRERLDQASELYDQARTTVLSKDDRRRTPYDNDLVRLALIYRADCAYDTAALIAPRDPEGAERMYRQAIRQYDNAARRYGNDPSALSAMMQIVNCYIALGDVRAASIAHERARERLAELDDSAFAASASPFNRNQWERWLESAVELDRLAAVE